MAECQGPYDYTDDTLTGLEAAISSPRFETYLREAGDPAYAVSLYLFNARVAKSLLFPLQMAEITVRNAINQVFIKDFGERWPFMGGFHDEYSKNSNDPPFSVITMARDRLQNVGVRHPTTSDVVAALTFDFWSNLFRDDYDRFLWAESGRLRQVFPRLPDDKGRPDVQILVRQINRLRNRIAHHEPIIERRPARKPHPDDIPLQDLHDGIMCLIGYRCETTEKWVRHHSTFGRTMRDKPQKGARVAGQPIGNAASKIFSLHQLHDRLDEALKDLAENGGIGLVHLPGQIPPYAALTANDVLLWSSNRLQGGYVPYEEGTVADALRVAKPRQVVCLPNSATMPEVAAIMYAKGVNGSQRPWLVIAMNDAAPPAPMGILVRPLVRIS